MANVVIASLGPLYTLEEVKAHLHVDSADDDVSIQNYMNAAEQAVLQYCNASLVPYGKEATFKQAALLLVGHYYANREAVVTGTIATALPFSVSALLDPHRWLRV
ncbi:MAG: phage gp6-like head-tail connector protein [Hyphomicrobiales bacterium]|nr:MAG: phage gp6-like head-tail connector protein [Hyphomicrobiales bacterium]